MPATPATFFPIFSVELRAVGFTGLFVDQLASGLANGLSQHILGGMSVITKDSGSLGVGFGVGFALLPSDILFTNLMSLAGKSFNGVSYPLMALAISKAIGTSISSCVVNSSHVSVGSGKGIGSIIPNGVPSIPFYESSFKTVGVVSVYEDLPRIIVDSVNLALPSSYVDVNITGSFSPSAATGIGTGFLK